MGRVTDDELCRRALDAATRAYAPYSKFHVGAALLCDDGAVIEGANVENASYGLCICAERTAVASAVASGRRAFRKIAVATDSSPPSPPCGMCRQVLAEFGDPTMLVRTRNAAGAEKQWTLEQLLPDAFTAKLMNR